MEAMASGVPVVASRVGGTPDMITDGVDGVLVDQADVPALASSLGRLWRDVGLRRALGEAARGRAVAQFDSRARAQCLLDGNRPMRSLDATGPRPAGQVHGDLRVRTRRSQESRSELVPVRPRSRSRSVTMGKPPR